ncbi:hypothetical protein DFR29_107247 [Tahibacter aquaticus]|uniref:Uncharacterized protein n=1 Tax=Tahibacter aquaticus TaxID=520092 RepID=A0A4R6YWM8_9GAMM|nr:hypothetical protein [Tahibacter aquaticus]TDR43234.1 hypothetical protein DFR29_107247 [Tahibacter aquaticus]
MRARIVQNAVLSAIVTAQTLLIALDSRRLVSTFSQAAQYFSLADGFSGWFSQGPVGVYTWILGLLPLLATLAVGAAAAWLLRALSATPDHLCELGQAIAVLALLQFIALTVVFWLQPPPPSSDWHNDGLAYTALLVLTATLWSFANPLLLWRAASGRSRQTDPDELHRLYAIALQRSREIASREMARSIAIVRAERKPRGTPPP